MRFVEADRDDAQIEIAWASRDAPSSAAQVLARGVVPDRWGVRALLQVGQAQGMVDILLAGSEPGDGSPVPYLHLLVSVDLKLSSNGPSHSRNADSSLPTICRPAKFPSRPRRL